MTTSTETKQVSNGYQSPCAIVATATAVPPHTITREDVKYYMGRVFDIPERRLEGMMSIVDNAQVHSRHMIFPIDYTVEPRSLEKTNNEYMQHAIELGQRAAEECLERAGMTPQDIDLIIPSPYRLHDSFADAPQSKMMGFRSMSAACNSPNWAALRGPWRWAGRRIICNRTSTVTLIIAVELPSLTFLRKDIASQLDLFDLVWR
jgi:alkylresorcinol/alkylpyrone synthase